MGDNDQPKETATATQPASWDDGVVLAGREPALEPGTQVGRFVVGKRLGEGGMGVVYAATDPKLNRTVAIKLVRAPLLGTPRHQRAQARMLREAQAMARMSHPNVITVHEVGLHGERVFIAMEFLDGDTLAQWCKQDGRTWNEVRDAFVSAGRGLAAAHESGVVHRDFKPQNVLVGSDDRVVVTDFGLARDMESSEGDDDDHVEPTNGAAGDLLTVTRTGGVVGTPRYMAPEQYDGTGNVDARADQFSFCVSMYEGLYGQLPFGGDTVAERHKRISAGRIESAPRSSDVPSQLLRALTRGLSRDPAERFASMDALLADLSFDPVRRRRLWLLGGGAAAAVVALGVLGYLQLTSSPKSAAMCVVDDAALAGVWDEGTQSALRAGLAKSGAPNHAQIAQRVEGIVGAYADAWKSASRDSCRATRVQGTQSERELELRTACLRRRLDDVRGLTAMLASPTRAVAARAVEASLSMTPVAACADLTALKAPVPLPDDPAKRARVEALQRRLAAAITLSKAGQYKPALAAAEALVSEVTAEAYGPLQAEVLKLVGDMQARTGKRQEAVVTLKKAASLAEASGHDDVLARARIALVHVAGYMLAKYDQGALYAELAEATIARLGGRKDLTGYLELSRGSLAYRQAKLKEAATRWANAVKLLKVGLGQDHVDVARALNNLAHVSSKLDRTEDAEKYFAEGLALREKLLGPDHLLVANTLVNLAGHYRRHGNHEGAKKAYERAVKIRLALQPNHPRTAGFIMSLAMIYMDDKQYDKSLVHLRRALAIYEASRSRQKGDLDYPHVLGTIANVLREQGKLAESKTYYQRAIDALVESGDTKHERAGAVYVGLGMTLSEMGKQREAIAYFRRTLAPWEALSKDHLNLGYPLTGIGIAELRAKRPAAAIAPLERALAIRTTKKGRPENLAETRFALARALWLSKRDRTRAVALATAAEKALAALGGVHETRRAEVRAWIAARD